MSFAPGTYHSPDVLWFLDGGTSSRCSSSESSSPAGARHTSWLLVLFSTVTLLRCQETEAESPLFTTYLKSDLPLPLPPLKLRGGFQLGCSLLSVQRVQHDLLEVFTEPETWYDLYMSSDHNLSTSVCVMLPSDRWSFTVSAQQEHFLLVDVLVRSHLVCLGRVSSCSVTDHLYI